MRMLIPADLACVVCTCVMVIVLMGLTTGTSQKNDQETFDLLNRYWDSIINDNSTKRRIFPPDTRRKVKRKQLSKFPYSAVVKISTGCTGNLISNQHVLTAAHCIHNRTQYIKPIDQIKVGFLKKNKKFRWYDVISHEMPYEFRHPRTWTVAWRYDYAVLKLSTTHRRKYFRLAGRITSRTPRIHFNGFPGDKKSNTMWRVDCTGIDFSYFLASTCDAVQGSSGSGVYEEIIYNGETERRIVGVLSATVTRINARGRKFHYNAIAKLYPRRLMSQVCRWAESPIGCMF